MREWSVQSDLELTGAMPSNNRSQTGPPLGHPRKPDRDRRVRQADRLGRILKLVALIQSRGRWTRKAIATELGVSERTVYRDLEALTFAGIPYYAEGPDQVLRLQEGYRFPLLTLTRDEAIGLAAADVLTSAPSLRVTQGVSMVSQKIRATASDGVIEMMDEVTPLIRTANLEIPDSAGMRDRVRTIHAALTEKRQLRGCYRSPYQKGTRQLRLHPHGFGLIKNAWYLIGIPDGSSELRTFRVSRFRSLELTSTGGDVPDSFDLCGYLGNAWRVYRGRPTVTVELRFRGVAARLISEQSWHHTQRILRGEHGSITVEYTVDGLPELLEWMLQWAGEVEVISPERLREQFRSRLLAALALEGSQ